MYHEPRAISKVEFPNGKVDKSDTDEGDRVLTPGEAYEVTRILDGVITSGTGAGYTSTACPSAAKTGPSEEESGAWFVGYTPRFSTAVWVGHPQTREYTGYGATTAGPIWQSYMESAQEGECEEFEVPEGMPELSGLDSEHTSSSDYSDGYYEEESYEAEEEDSKDKGGDEEEGGSEGGGGDEAAPAPESAPAPAPTPSAPPSVGGGISP